MYSKKKRKGGVKKKTKRQFGCFSTEIPIPMWHFEGSIACHYA